MPDGQKLNPDEVTGVAAAKRVVTVQRTSDAGGAAYTFTAATPAVARAVAKQIQDIAAGWCNSTDVKAFSVAGAVGTATWSSVLPATLPLGTAFTVRLKGTGFMALRRSLTHLGFGLSNPPTYTYGPGQWQADSDGQISIFSVTLPAGATPGTYKVYYSTNGGSTWTDTGLTVTVNAGTVWTSITPSNLTGNVNNPEFTIAGSGFSGSGINAIKLSQGILSGEWLTTMTTMAVATDTSIVLNADIFYMFPSTYQLYYSCNSGMTWTNTGLSVTAT
jgi:hypothetical protein